MRENKSRKNPQDWLPLYFDEELKEDAPQLTDEEIKELQDDMAYFNSLSPEELWGNKKAGD